MSPGQSAGLPLGGTAAGHCPLARRTTVALAEWLERRPPQMQRRLAAGGYEDPPDTVIVPTVTADAAKLYR